ncbi:MAG: DegV family protein [Thermoleophilaceae bacterium]
MAVAVVTDTTHYLPRELVEARGIREVSLYVTFQGNQTRESEILRDTDAFYDALRSASEMPTTSQPSIGDFLGVWEPIVRDGDDVVSIHIASGISGTYDSALQAKARLVDDGLDDGRIAVVDSSSGCGGLGLIVLAACAAADAGGDVEAVADRARAAAAVMKMWFAVETLEFLRRGGRIGSAAAWLGSALKIKPILTLEEEITPVERVRTSGRAFERMVDYLRQLRDNGSDAWVVQHIQAPDVANRLIDRGRELYGSEPQFIGEIGPVIGAHVGPGLIGVGALPAGLLA